MIRLTLLELRRHLRDWLFRANGGEALEVTYYGRPFVEVRAPGVEAIGDPVEPAPLPPGDSVLILKGLDQPDIPPGTTYAIEPCRGAWLDGASDRVICTPPDPVRKAPSVAQERPQAKRRGKAQGGA